MNLRHLILGFLITFQLPAQSSRDFWVMDATSRQPVPYVNASIPDRSTGTVGDLDGKCTLPEPAAGQLIEFSAIGYRSSKVKFTPTAVADTVFLTPAPLNISGVKVTARALKNPVTLGHFNEDRGGSVSFANAQLGAELGTVVLIKQETFLKSAHFQLNHAKGDSLLLRLHIYDFREGTVGPDLLTENVLIREAQRKGKFSVDLSHLELFVDHPVLLSLEWLRDFDELGNKSITFDVKKVKRSKGTFIRFFSNGPLDKLPYKTKYQPCFYFTGKQ